MRTKIRIDPETGFAYIIKALREEGFVGDVMGLANARTLTLILPGTKLADVRCSLKGIIRDIDLRIEYEDEEMPDEEAPKESAEAVR